MGARYADFASLELDQRGVVEGPALNSVGPQTHRDPADVRPVLAQAREVPAPSIDAGVDISEHRPPRFDEERSH